MAAKKKSNVSIPRNPDEWKNLVRQAISAAEKSNDRRINGLKQALVSGNIEDHLRKLGIVSPEDLVREFPSKS